MQSNVTVPVSGSKFKLWLLIVVLAVLVSGGGAYGYYSWYKSNEPPPSLETKDGSGLQGLMKIQGGSAEVEGFAKLEAGDVKECAGALVMEGSGTDYLYSPKEATFKDFYDSVAVDVGRTFMLMFYSPGEKVGDVQYNEGFYLFPTAGTNYKANHVKLEDLANYKVPAYRSVIVLHDGSKMSVCGSGGVVPANGVKELSAAWESALETDLKPLPKGWVLVPFGWNMEYVGFFVTDFLDYVKSAWVQVGSEVIKVKDVNLDKIGAAIASSGTRSVWVNMKDVTDVIKVVKGKNEGGGGDAGKDTVAPSISTVAYSDNGDSGRIDVVFSEEFKAYSFNSICKVDGVDSVDCSKDAVNLLNGDFGAVNDGGAKVTVNLNKKLDKGFYMVSFVGVTDAAGNVANSLVKTFEAGAADTIPPEVVSVESPIISLVKIRFNEPVDISKAPIDGLFSLKNKETGKFVALLKMTLSDTQMIKDSVVDLEVLVVDSNNPEASVILPDETYLLSITSSLVDLAGNAIVPVDKEFASASEMADKDPPELKKADYAQGKGVIGLEFNEIVKVVNVNKICGIVPSISLTCSEGSESVKFDSPVMNTYDKKLYGVPLEKELGIGFYSISFIDVVDAVGNSAKDISAVFEVKGEADGGGGGGVPPLAKAGDVCAVTADCDVGLACVLVDEGKNPPTCMDPHNACAPGTCTEGTTCGSDEDVDPIKVTCVNEAPSSDEICSNGIDDDGDGLKDCWEEKCLHICTIACDVDADCAANGEGFYCVSVEGTSSQCASAASFSTICSANNAGDNPNPTIYFSKQPVWVQCVTPD